MLKKILNYFRRKKVEKLVLKRNINEGFIKILKIEHFNEYDFVWIELLNHNVIRRCIGLPPYEDVERADYPFEIIALKNGKFLEEQPRVRLALRFKEYNEDYLSLEKNKDNMFFLEVLHNKQLGEVAYLKDFEKPFNVFLTKDLTKEFENQIKNFKAYFVKMDENVEYSNTRVFVYDMDNNKFVEQIFVAKPDEDFKNENVKNTISNVVSKYLKKITPKKETISLEDWNGVL